MFQPTSLIANFDGMFSSQHVETPKFASLLNYIMYNFKKLGNLKKSNQMNNGNPIRHIN
jgi:hypothetical protein